MVYLAKILTVSDSVARGEAEDRSGVALARGLTHAEFSVLEQRCVGDGVDSVADALRELAADFCGVIITTGGTGFGPRDLTPEGTSAVLERNAPGLSEAMRAVNDKGRLSRGVAGTIGSSLVLNTPGSPTGAIECLEAVIDVIPHALELLAGHQPHPHPADGHREH